MTSDFVIKNKKGTITLLVLVFSGIMILLFGGMVGFIFVQHRVQVKKIDKEKSLQIAEAGLDYYKWFLSHYPGDLQDGTGLPGPYEHEYYDPEGGAIGKFSLEVTGLSQCGLVRVINIASTGWTYNDPSVKRVANAQYTRPSVAQYAYVLDDNVQVGSTQSIKGPYHSNGGIVMYGANDSLVTSAKTTWNCTPSYDLCAAPFEVKPGIFGSGPGYALWQFPVEPIDFVGVSADLAQMKTLAQNYGRYFSTPTPDKGYHVIFKNDGTFDIYRVTALDRVWGYSTEEGWHWDKNIIKNEIFMQNYSVPNGCGLIFVEADLWLEGVVSGKTTIVSANLIDANVDTSIFLKDNITYTNYNGLDGLTVVAEQDILALLYVPDQMELNGIFIAQKGRVGRNLYTSAYAPYDIRQKITLNGTVVSKKRVVWLWGYWGGLSGFLSREIYFDRDLMYDPPPMTPYADDEYMFIKWEEVD